MKLQIYHILILGFVLPFFSIAQNSHQVRDENMYSQLPVIIPLSPEERIWFGAIENGYQMPVSKNYQFDFYANNLSNQLQPLLLSNKGLWVWSEEPYEFEIIGDSLKISNQVGEVKFGRFGKTLAEARSYASTNFFPPSGKLPDKLLFSEPQYNTWIELTYHQNEADVLKYAHAIINNGFPPGVLMIDDTWQEDYGLWNFHPGRFPNPKAMIEELHQMGFKVMLWICPFVSPDQFLIYNKLKKNKAFLLEKSSPGGTWESSTEPSIVRWWNGASALLDFTNPKAVEWFYDQLKKLVSEYGVDGFKFDAGDMNFYISNSLSKEPVTPNRQCELYAQFGLQYPLNEYRACWKMAGQPLAQRLHDKKHTWEDLQRLIPDMITEGLVGYTFSCPDMIGGGEYTSFLNINEIDQDLIVRSAQCHALMPMMQFSVAPWRILDSDHLDAVNKAVALRKEYNSLIMKLAVNSAETGEPILANLEYYFPGENLEFVNDQFMLGPNLMVAPMVKTGTNRTVVFPKGTWIGDDGKSYSGGKSYSIDVPIKRIPYFKFIEKKKSNKNK